MYLRLQIWRHFGHFDIDVKFQEGVYTVYTINKNTSLSVFVWLLCSALGECRAASAMILDGNANDAQGTGAGFACNNSFTSQKLTKIDGFTFMSNIKFRSNNTSLDLQRGAI